jgi:hypothetical protein
LRAIDGSPARGVACKHGDKPLVRGVCVGVCVLGIRGGSPLWSSVRALGSCRGQAGALRGQGSRVRLLGNRASLPAALTRRKNVNAMQSRALRRPIAAEPGPGDAIRCETPCGWRRRCVKAMQAAVERAVRGAGNQHSNCSASRTRGSSPAGTRRVWGSIWARQPMPRHRRQLFQRAGVMMPMRAPHTGSRSTCKKGA